MILPLRKKCPSLSVLSPNTDNEGKIRTRITPNADTFYAVYTSLANNYLSKIHEKYIETMAVPIYISRTSAKHCLLNDM